MNIYKTSDLSLAAYLLMNNIQLLKAEKSKDFGKFVFLFEDTDFKCKNLSVEFLKSDFLKYDNNIRNLKKMLHSS